jgi:hypothetical protein
MGQETAWFYRQEQHSYFCAVAVLAAMTAIEA